MILAIHKDGNTLELNGDVIDRWVWCNKWSKQIDYVLGGIWQRPGGLDLNGRRSADRLSLVPPLIFRNCNLLHLLQQV